MTVAINLELYNFLAIQECMYSGGAVPPGSKEPKFRSSN